MLKCLSQKEWSSQLKITKSCVIQTKCYRICNMSSKLKVQAVPPSGTEMMDGQLMGEFEGEAKELEADSWSLGVEQQYLQQLDKELVKRQDVIYGIFD